MGAKITTTDHEVVVTDQDFRRIQSSIRNEQFIEIKSGLSRKMINPKQIVSVEEIGSAEELEKKRYKPANTQSLSMTPEEMEAMQNKMQPMKILFDIKKKAMEEMLEKENVLKTATMDTIYGRYRTGVEKSVAQPTDEEAYAKMQGLLGTTAEDKTVTEKIEIKPVPMVEEEVAVKKPGRPKKAE